MMTLIEAIEHCKDMAKCEYGECAEEHRQLAEWLMELQDIKTHGKHTETHGVCSEQATDLIRREDIYEALEQYDRKHVEPQGYDDYYNGFLQVIGIIQSADAVEVVRCKDCKHRDLFSCPLTDNDFQKNEDYCSWGERREDGEDE